MDNVREQIVALGREIWPSGVATFSQRSELIVLFEQLLEQDLGQEELQLVQSAIKELDKELLDKLLELFRLFNAL